MKVTNTIAPDYSKIIRNPMDFGTMREKIKKKSYNSLMDFDKDMQLIFKNCIKYNGSSSDYGKVSAVLLSLSQQSKHTFKILSLMIAVCRLDADDLEIGILDSH
jgi:bromodomain-containing protein 7/9